MGMAIEEHKENNTIETDVIEALLRRFKRQLSRGIKNRTKQQLNITGQEST
jgi:hypothetical protein